MTSPPTTARGPRPVQRFKPTSGTIVGYAGLVLAAATLVYVVVDVRSVVGLRIGLGAVFFGLVVWVTQLRPRATAYHHHVVLKNSVRDSHVPFVDVDEITLGQTLNLWVDGQRYTCIGIGQSIREEIKSYRKREQPVGSSRLTEFTLRAERANNDERAMSYQTYVVTRLEELVDAAKRGITHPDAEPPQVTEAGHHLAWPEVTALVVTGVAFVVACFL